MTEINLLPWREKKKEQDRRNFMIFLLAGAVGAVILVLMINLIAAQLIKLQELRNNLLQTEITSLEGKIKEIQAIKQKRDLLISRMKVVQNLQITREFMPHFFDELIEAMNSGVYVTKLEGKGNLVTIYGYSESNTSVSNLMRYIEKNEWVHSPVLTEIKKMQDKNQSADKEFKLSFLLGSSQYLLVNMPKGTETSVGNQAVTGAKP